MNPRVYFAKLSLSPSVPSLPCVCSAQREKKRERDSPLPLKSSKLVRNWRKEREIGCLSHLDLPFGIPFSPLLSQNPNFTIVRVFRLNPRFVIQLRVTYLLWASLLFICRFFSQFHLDFGFSFLGYLVPNPKIGEAFLFVYSNRTIKGAYWRRLGWARLYETFWDVRTLRMRYAFRNQVRGSWTCLMFHFQELNCLFVCHVDYLIDCIIELCASYA